LEPITRRAQAVRVGDQTVNFLLIKAEFKAKVKRVSGEAKWF
jgi:hypothetical protein